MKLGKTLLTYRWFLLGIVFVSLNGYAVFRSTPGPVGEPEFAAPDTGWVFPAKKELSALGGKEPLHLAFKTPMVAEEQLNIWRPDAPIRLKPMIQGRWKWHAVDQLMFEPKEEWPAEFEFTASLNEGVTDAGGHELSSLVSQTYQTKSLELMTWRQTKRTPRNQITVAMEFSGAVEGKLLKENLVLTDEKGKAVPFSVNYYTRKRHLIETRPTVAKTLTAHLEKGAFITPRGDALPEAMLASVAVDRTFKITRMEPKVPAFEPVRVSAYFSAQVDINKLKPYVSVEPAVPFSLRQLPYRWYGPGVELVGEFKPGQVYGITFRKGMPGHDGSLLEKSVVRTVSLKDRPTKLAFRNSGAYLSTQGARKIELSAVNGGTVTFRAQRIYPNNLVSFAMRRSGKLSSYYGEDHQSLSHESGSMKVTIKGKKNEIVNQSIDLTPLMGEHRSGAFLVEARAHNGGGTISRLVVVSDIGVAVKPTDGGLFVWANSLMKGTPMADAEVRVYSETNQELASMRTNVDGIVQSGKLAEKPFLITLQHGEDLTYLRLNGHQLAEKGDTGGAAYQEGYEAYVFTERGIYRPGETAFVKAVVRDEDLKAPEAFPVELVVFNPEGREQGSYSAKLSENGTAAFEVPFKDYALSGRYRFDLRLPGKKEALGSTSISVESFVPPTIAVDVERVKKRAVAGETLTFDVAARFLFGATAANLPARAWVALYSLPFSHPDWEAYTFGDEEKKFKLQGRDIGVGKTGEKGLARFTYTLPEVAAPPAAVKVLMGTRIQEPSGRSSVAYTSRIVDFYPHYIGIDASPNNNKAEVGRAHTIALAAVKPDGTAAEKVPLEVVLKRIHWATVLRQDGEILRYISEKRETLVDRKELTLEKGMGAYTVTLAESGTYRLSVTDHESGASSSTRFTAYRPDQGWNQWAMAEPDRLALSLDKDHYEPGETAKLLIKSPFAGRALVSIQSNQLLDHQLVVMNENTIEVTIPVKAEYLPNVYVQVNVIRKLVPGAIQATCRASGIVPMLVRQSSDRLALTLEAPEKMRPMEILRLRTKVEGYEPGTPVEVVFAAVDEAICGLTDFETPDPLSYFRRKRSHGVTQYDLYGQLLPEPGAIAGGPSQFGGGGNISALRARVNPIRSRRFVSLARWSASVSVDADGWAETEFEVPEFAGALRFMAVGISGGRFGSADREVKVARPVVMQHGLPRFLAPGDRFDMPVFVFNVSDQERKISVTVASDGPLSALSYEPDLVLGAGEQALMKIPMLAEQSVGTATVSLHLEAGDASFTDAVEIAVRPAAPRTIASGSGRVGPGEKVLVSMPKHWLNGTAEQELLSSPLPSIDLGGGLDYLMRYPYGCLEQTTSSAFPLVYLPELMNMVRPGSMTQADVRDMVDSGIQRIIGMQHYDGGFQYWPNSGHYYAWGSVYASHFLTEADRAGYDVPEDALERVVSKMKSLLERQVPDRDTQTAPWNRDMQIRAYASLVLSLQGKTDRRWLNWLNEKFEDLPVDAKIRLAASFAATGDRRKARELLEKIQPQSLVKISRNTDEGLSSPSRESGLLLMAWLEVDPENPAVPVLARTLSGLRVNGRWGTTQENAICLMALGKYGRMRAATAKPFVAFADVDGKKVSIDSKKAMDIPLSGDEKSVVLHNEGPGELYFYWQSAGVQEKGPVEEHDSGISIRRQFFDLNHQALDPENMTQGQTVVVQVTVDPKGQARKNLAIEDLLPAGLEIENPRLKNSEIVKWATGKFPARHLDMRDDRLVVFADTLREKASLYYIARAVSTGTFVLPPVSVECMYDSEIRSVHGAGRVVIHPEEKVEISDAAEGAGEDAS